MLFQNADSIGGISPAINLREICNVHVHDITT